MSAALVKYATGTTGAATTYTSITPAFATASTSGNLIALIVASDATVATPTGWTLDKSQVNNNGHYHFRRTSTGETTFAAATVTGASCWWLLEISGAAATPVDGVVSTGFAAGGSSISTGTATVTTPTGALAIASFASTAASPPSFSAETNGYTEVAADIATTKTSGINIGLVVAVNAAPTGSESSTATLSAGAGRTAILVVYKSGAASNVAPTANAGLDQTIQATYTAAGVSGPTVTLTGAASTDPDGTVASYAWTQTSGPTVTLSSSTAVSPTFTAPRFGGILVFGLVVTDNSGASSTQDTVQVTVTGVAYGYVRVAGAWVKRPLFVRRAGAWS